jgi:hypothetical protein
MLGLHVLIEGRRVKVMVYDDDDGDEKTRKGKKSHEDPR